MRKIILGFIISISIATMNAQEYGVKFGKVSKEDLSLNVYEADTTAEAVILYEEGMLKYDLLKDQYSYYYKAKVKILKKDGTHFSNITIPTRIYEKQKETLSNISATSYNLKDGKITKSELTKQHIENEQINEHLQLTKFTIPEVYEGTIIEYKYTITSDFIENIPDMKIQHIIPVIKSRIEYQIPEFYIFKIKQTGEYNVNLVQTRGFVTIGGPQQTSRTVTTSLSGGNSQAASIQTLQYQTNNYICEASNIPSLKKEPYVYCISDHETRIKFELSSFTIPGRYYKTFNHSWKEVDEVLSQNGFDGDLRVSYPFKEEVMALKRENGNNLEKLRSALKLTQTKMAWNGVYSILSSNAAKAAKEGQGSSAEVNFVLNSVLNDLGYKTIPVIMSPRSQGKMITPNIYKISTFIIAVICENGDYTYLDATNKNEDLNLLSPDLQADNAHFYKTNITKNLSFLSRGNVQNINFSCTINPNGEINGDIALSLRQQLYLDFLDNNTDENAMKDIYEKHGITINKFENIDNGTDGTWKMNITFTPNMTNDFMYLNASVIPIESTIFTSSERTMPIEFDFPYTIRIKGNVKLPDGYSIEELPQDVTFKACDNSITCQYKTAVTNGYLQIYLSFDLARATFFPKEYHDLKQIFDLFKKISESSIVLKR